MLKSKGMDVMGFFYRHNIHPFTECLKREEALKNYAEDIGLAVIYPKDYQMEEFMRNVVFRENDRCAYCYHSRLEATAKIAKHGNFDAFTTTLLYSKFQNHDLITDMGRSVGKATGVDFYYEDFRTGWKTGIVQSKALNMYRQQYCGCIYSEKQRFFKP
jgi:predicted adenine nucleotide alpha hydrolase (AANH) superfamily ATPase